MAKCKIFVFHLIILRDNLGKLCKLEALDSVAILKYLPQFYSQGRFKFQNLPPLNFFFFFFLHLGLFMLGMMPTSQPSILHGNKPNTSTQDKQLHPNNLHRLVSQRLFSHKGWVYPKLPFFTPGQDVSLLIKALRWECWLEGEISHYPEGSSTLAKHLDLVGKHPSSSTEFFFFIWMFWYHVEPAS